MKTIAFFNNKGGVGKTTLTYHVACMFRRLGVDVLVADLDPQANLTAAFLDEGTLERVWDAKPPRSISGAVDPLLQRLGDFSVPHVEELGGIGLIPGDVLLSTFEDRLALAWSGCLDDNVANAADAFRVTTSFYRIVESAARARGTSVVLLDVGPNLGALNRAALVAADFIVVPLAADLFSLRGLKNLGPTLHEWREGWRKRRSLKVPDGLVMPHGSMDPLGYVVLQHAARRTDEPARAYSQWIERFPAAFHREVLRDAVPTGEDPYRIALLRHYRSLLPMALEVRKPIFELRAADGAIGSHAATVRDAHATFSRLTREIASRAGIVVPEG